MKRIALFAALTCLFALWQFPGSTRAAEPTYTEALDEVNAIRTRNGLRPYTRDDGLTRAAARCAITRAAKLHDGHTANDFAALDPGVTAHAAGCAAWEPAAGWGSCAMFDDYVFAGAAWAMGADGKRYMHLFVRGGSGRTLGQRVPLNGAGQAAATAAPVPCAGPTCATCAAPPSKPAPSTTVRVAVHVGAHFPHATAVVARVLHPFAFRHRYR